MQLARNKYHEHPRCVLPIDGHKLYQSAAVNFVEQLVSQLYSIPTYVIRSQKRGNANVSFARHTAIYLCHIALGMSCSELSNIFRRDRSTITHAFRIVEDERDNPEFDIIIEFLELEICNWNRCWKATF